MIFSCCVDLPCEWLAMWTCAQKQRFALTIEVAAFSMNLAAVLVNILSKYRTSDDTWIICKWNERHWRGLDNNESYQDICDSDEDYSHDGCIAKKRGEGWLALMILALFVGVCVLTGTLNGHGPLRSLKMDLFASIVTMSAVLTFYVNNELCYFGQHNDEDYTDLAFGLSGAMSVIACLMYLLAMADKFRTSMKVGALRRQLMRELDKQRQYKGTDTLHDALL